MNRVERFSITAVAGLFSVLSLAGPLTAAIHRSDLTITRSVTEGDWLRLKLSVLGLRLSYPAYRIDLNLNENNVIGFNFWISAPLALHLEEGGTGEMERVLAYHAGGMRDQVIALIRDDFPQLWPDFDVLEDFGGVFLAPGDDFDSLPRQLAYWRGDRLYWQ